MTDAQRIERARRAQAAWDEFILPILTECRGAYGDRIVEIAATELNRDKRTDKITALSTALRVLEQVERGLQATIMDGEIAHKNKLRVDQMERLSPAGRRLVDMLPH